MGKRCVKEVFLFCGHKSIEEQTIREVLAQEKCRYDDVSLELAYSTDEAVAEMFRRYIEKYNRVYAIGDDFPLERVPEEMKRHVIRLNRAGVPGHLPVLLQVCALVRHRPTAYELQVAKFAACYLDKDNQDYEVMYITLRDRLARGGTLVDEAEAAAAMDGCATRNTLLEGKTFSVFFCGLSRKAQLAVVDQMMVDNLKDCQLKVYFVDSELEVRNAVVASNNYSVGNQLTALAVEQYEFEKLQPLRPGVHLSKITLKDSGLPLTAKELMERVENPFL